MTSETVYRFGNFELDSVRRSLLFEGELVSLRPKAMETLVLLVERHGEVVSKEEILSEVWPDTFVEENALSRSVHDIRKKLRELAESEGEIIRTVPKTGYAFVLPVEEVVTRNGPSDIPIQFDETRQTVPIPEARGIRWHFLAMVLLGTVILTSFSMWTGFTDDGSLVPVSAGNRSIRSLAVIPLSVVGDDKRASLISLGLTDTLISRLGSLNRFVVRPYSSVQKYSQTDDVVAAGRELEVDAVIEGTVQISDDRYKVNLKLIDVRDGAIIWTDDFERAGKDIFGLQDAISLEAASSLILDLTPDDKQRLLKRSTDNDQAWFLYLKARDLWLKRSRLDEVVLYQQAVEIDPNFALAYLGMADSLAFAANPGPAEQALETAARLDPELEGIYATKGFVQMFHRWDWEGARDSLQRSIALSPYCAKSHHWLGIWHEMQGDFESAGRSFDAALEVDPNFLPAKADKAQLAYFQKDYAAAERLLDEIKFEAPEFGNTGTYLHYLKLKTEPQKEIQRAILSGIEINRKNGVRGPKPDLSKAGPAEIRKAFVQVSLDPLVERNEQFFRIAMYYVVLGENEKAIEWIERGVEAKMFLMPFIAIDPLFEPLHYDPRFRAAVERMGLRIAGG